MEYPLMAPPFHIKNFDEMSETDAKEHYEWYLSEIPNRLKLLETSVKVLKPKQDIEFDFTKESLIGLWSWYLDNVEIVQKTEEEYQLEVNNSNSMTRKSIMKEKITIGWLAIAMDISIYFAECFVRNNEVLQWGLMTKPKSLACVNKPVVIGFRHNMQLDATNILFVQTRKILKGLKKKDALLQLYDNWVNHI